MMREIAAAVLVVGLSAPAAASATGTTGRYCAESSTEGCAGYLVGFLEAYGLVQTLHERGSEPPNLFCWPSEKPFGEIVETVRAYLILHPESNDLSMPLVILGAFREAGWICPPEEQTQ